MANSLEMLKNMEGAISKGDPAITPYLRDTMLEGNPDVVLRPAQTSDLKEIMKLCRTDRIPLTACGSRTSMTGSAAALSGALVATEKLNKFISIDDKGEAVTATAETGIPLIEFKNKLEENGLFYPIHPTSVNEILLGATIATNATGDDTFKYGPTRRWVRRMKVMLMSGEEIEFVRPKESHPAEIKGRAGYHLEGPEIERFIGSEGTLGIITEVTVDVLRGVPEFYSIMIPFPTNEDAISFIIRQSLSGQIKLNLRSLEFIDGTGIEIMKKHEDFPKLPDNAKALVYSNTEFEAGKFEESVGLWLETISKFGLDQTLIDSTIVAASRKEKEDMHSWRHFIPEWINETYRKFETVGGGKVGGDWWVPLKYLKEMLDWFYEISNEAKIPYIAYAHIGNGHPHTNYFTRNSRERETAKELVIKASRKAVEFGGGVAGEHGLGKIKRYLLPIQHNKAIIEKMKALKTHYDPKWLLGQGNIFEAPRAVSK